MSISDCCFQFSERLAVRSSWASTLFKCLTCA
jgi:hypothetical protein